MEGIKQAALRSSRDGDCRSGSPFTLGQSSDSGAALIASSEIAPFASDALIWWAAQCAIQAMNAHTRQPGSKRASERDDCERGDAILSSIGKSNCVGQSIEFF